MSIVAQILKDVSGFVIKNGIPRHKKVYSPLQNQTQEAFGFKWKKRETYESEVVQKASKKWLDERYFLSDRTLRDIVTGKRVLDAGCGSGHSALLFFGEVLHECIYVGVDISDAVDVAKLRFQEKGLPGEFIQMSLMDLPLELGNFDVIFSEGALHHTDSTEEAIRFLSSRLNPSGLFMFYVYKKKGPIREFTDDYIRDRLSDLKDEQAWQALVPLSKLGQKLGELDIELKIEDPIDILEIPAGKINLQRLFYWHVFKAYYRPGWTLNEMNHVNFDWYRPHNCHRQTPKEVKNWVESTGLRILKMNVEEAGITVVAEKTIERIR
jgi:SAM-dependent methyltransferase